MTLILDSGALIRLERGDREMWVRLRAARADGTGLRTHGGVVGQVWRGRGSRHALLARALASIDVVGLDEPLGREAGGLLARARQHDVVDAAVVALAEPGDRIYTSDPDDLDPLVLASEREVVVVRV